MSQGTGTPPHPENEAMLARWRVGLVAYREAMRQELWAHDCWVKGHEAMQAAFPEIALEQARLEMTTAIAWASTHHNGWLWKGVPRREWIWPPTAEGVGLYRNNKPKKQPAKAPGRT